LDIETYLRVILNEYIYFFLTSYFNQINSDFLNKIILEKNIYDFSELPENVKIYLFFYILQEASLHYEIPVNFNVNEMLNLMEKVSKDVDNEIINNSL